MRNAHLLFFSILFTASFFSSAPVLAQTVDSVIVTGRINRLSAQLYRESPTVLVSRNNILQADRELVRPAPLNVDGTFRVALPLIYPQEELYFNYGRIATAFLASPGTVSIELDADSLFTAAVPFHFGGVNAQVNQQFARYKAFEAAYPDKPDGKKLTDRINGVRNSAVYALVSSTYQAPFRAFAVKEKPYPLLARWVSSMDRYNAASFVYDKASYEGEELSEALSDSLRPANDQLLTAARASAMNRFANYAMQQGLTTEINRQTGGLSVRTLSALLLRYGRISETERTRLQGYVDQNTAKASDLRFFDTLIKRSNDTIQRLVNYEMLLQRSRNKFDSATTGYLAAYWLASALPGLSLDIARLLYDYARPQITDPALAQSLNELYQLETKDSVRIRAAVQALTKGSDNISALEISPNVFITRDALASGQSLFDRVITANRGKVIYVVMTSLDSEAGRQVALDAQRLRNAYRSRDFALVYLPNVGEEANLWAEFSAKHQLAGDHLLTTLTQLEDIISRLRSFSEQSSTVINRAGKITKRNAPLPGAFEEVRKVVDKNL